MHHNFKSFKDFKENFTDYSLSLSLSISLQSPAITTDGTHSTPPPRPQWPPLPSNYCNTTMRHTSEVCRHFTPHLWPLTQYLWHLNTPVCWSDPLGWQRAFWISVDRLQWWGELHKAIWVQPTKEKWNNYATLCLSHPGCRTCGQTCSSSSALLSFPASLKEWCITCTGTQEIPSHTREYTQGIERRHYWRHGSWHAQGYLLLYFRLCYLCSWFWTTEWYHSEADSSSLRPPGFSTTITSAPVALIPPPSIVPVCKPLNATNKRKNWLILSSSFFAHLLVNSCA